MPYAPGAHPRSAGTFARVLARYVRERRVLTLMDALSRITLMPARRLEADGDYSRRLALLEELKAMTVRPSQFNPEAEVPEKNWFYRLAKRLWFNDFGAYRGMDHGKTSAPAVLAKLNGK